MVLVSNNADILSVVHRLKIYQELLKFLYSITESIICQYSKMNPIPSGELQVVSFIEQYLKRKEYTRTFMYMMTD